MLDYVWAQKNTQKTQVKQMYVRELYTVAARFIGKQSKELRADLSLTRSKQPIDILAWSASCKACFLKQRQGSRFLNKLSWFASWPLTRLLWLQ